MNYFNLDGSTSFNNIQDIDTNNVYHYTSKDGLLEILKGGKLHFSHLAFVNDKLELLDIFQNLKDMERDIIEIANNSLNKTKRSELEPIIQNMLEDILNFKTFLGGERAIVFTLSFCRNEDSLCMWSNYTNKLGYNILVDMREMKNSIKNCISRKNIILNYRNIIYDTNKKKQILRELFKDFFNEFISICKGNCNECRAKLETLRLSLLNIIILYAPFFKRNILKQEEEIRFSLTVDTSILKEYIRFKESNGINVPYFNLGGDFSNCYKKIKIGPLAKEFNEQSLFLYLKYVTNNEAERKSTNLYNLSIGREDITRSEISYRW